MTASNQTKLEFQTLDGGGRVATLTLNRPDQANAFSGQMMDEITAHIKAVKSQSDIRVLILTGAGKHFSAGADLHWMQASARLSYDENLRDAGRLRSMFEEIVSLGIPKVAALSGASYGGAVGLVACCDFAIATENAKFCLSEAKLGLLPAVIAPYLLRKMRPGQLRRLALTGKVFDASEARDFGLVEVVTNDLETSVKAEVNALLTCGPDAQRSINSLFETLRANHNAQCDETVQAISRARTGAEGQAGLGSFFGKSAPPWTRVIP